MDENATPVGVNETIDAVEHIQTSQAAVQVTMGQIQDERAIEQLARVTSNRMNLSPPRFTDGTELQSASDRGLEMAVAGEQIVPQHFPSHKEGFQLLAHKASSPGNTARQNQDLAHIELNAAQEGGNPAPAAPASPGQIQIRSNAALGIEGDLKVSSSRNLNEKQNDGMEKQNSTLIAVNSQFPESDSLHGLGPNSMLSNQMLNQFSLLKIDSL